MKGLHNLKFIRLIVLATAFFFINYTLTSDKPSTSLAGTKSNQQAIIIEVSQNPHHIKDKIMRDFPKIEVVLIFDELFQGLALKAKPNELQKLARVSFVKGFYPVQTYVTEKLLTFSKYKLDTAVLFKNRPEIESKNLGKIAQDESIIFPQELNDTPYTGKGVKVAVIDTGVDMNHPDLHANYKGGFDFVDLDDNPQETREEEGMPTTHGTHVAGIIAANGHIKGVAPDAEIYAYRALGPGGVGSSIQIIAAMEQAMKDGVDIMNLSLGNTVNGPDYPTSRAVVEASNRGVAVVVANGNAGPDNWTIGAPATARTAFSVGAYAAIAKKAFLYEPLSGIKIRINELPTSMPWHLTRDYQIKQFEKSDQMHNRIVIIRQDETSLYEAIEMAIEQGAVAILIQQVEEAERESSVPIEILPTPIPIAFISAKNGEKLKKIIDSQYVQTIVEIEEQVVAPFSSRGPVTINWEIKPNIVAPGVNVLSTIPNGYDAYNGTSMATPHVAGVVALMKEAHPEWSNRKIFAALETTATKLTDKKENNLAPFIQGSGFIRPNKAIHADVIIENGLLTFGKTDTYIERTTTDVTFHNTSNKQQEITIKTPKKKAGLNWHLPNNFSIEPGEHVTIPFTLQVNELFLQEGIHDGWINVRANNDRIQLPYLFVNRTDTYKKIAGFSMRINPLEQDDFIYELYATERAKFVQVQLYEPDTLLYVDTLLQLKNISPGLHEGKIKQTKVTERGLFYGLIIVQLANGEIVNYESPIHLP